MSELTEDTVRVIAHKAINERLNDLRDNFCKPKHERIEDLDKVVHELSRCMNGKFNRLYILLVGVLVGIISTFIGVLLK